VTVTDLDETAEAPAPPVVVAVVTRDAGPWLEETLASVAGQDYPNLSILVLATGESEGLLARVAAVAPTAYVRRLEGDLGYGPAANDVLQTVDGAAFFAFCHDDVILDTHAVRALVEEAYRSNAGIVGPKLVEWHEPSRLLHVGVNVDHVGATAPTVERGELDQEQHDAVRDVFLVPGACLLVRADLFATLGGFDPAISLLGEDLDLCWRAQVAGARVVVVPAAAAQHRESMAERPPAEPPADLVARHRLRTVLTCYGRWHLALVLPRLVALSVIEVLHGLATKDRTAADAHVRAWRWNLRRTTDLRARRRALRAIRQFPDREVRRLQVGGSLQLRTYFRAERHAGERIRARILGLSHELSEGFTNGPFRIAVAAWAVVVVLFLVGTRELLLQRIPSVGGLAAFDAGPFELLSTYLRGWRDAGLGADAPQPSAFALLGLAGLPLLGGMGLLQQLLVLGCIPAGFVGAWRVTHPLGSRLGRAAGLLVYAVLPLPYDALARGSWAGLLVYAAAPWILHRLIAACGDLPSAHGPVIRRKDLRAVVTLGILVALLAAFVPLVVLLVPVLAVALVAGAALTGGGRRARGALTVAAGASLVAVVLHLPWTFDFFLPGSDWWSTGGVSPVVHDATSLGSLLRFDTGAGDHSSIGWAVLVAAALPLLIGREWRFAWAVRCWCVALTGWALAWLGGQGLLGVPLPPADVLLPPAGAALALAAGLGVLAFERDLRGYHFGWRQLASLVAAGGVLVSVAPLAVGAIDGAWGMPGTDHAASLGFLRHEEVQAAGEFRVLWLGDPKVLPVAGFRLADDLAYGIAEDGPGQLTERWSAPAYASTTLVAEALRLAAAGGTERLGRMLGALGIRYLVLAEQLAPARTGADRQPLPAGLPATVARQLDLRRIQVDPALIVYENTAWVPVRAQLTGAAAAAVAGSGGLAVAAANDLAAGATPLGAQADRGTVYLAEPSSSRWQVRVGGHGVERARALGWANRFDVAAAGPVSVRYRTSPLRWLAVLAQLGLWVGAIVFLVRRRRPESIG
jgi:GT2 family glycosyltransferase